MTAEWTMRSARRSFSRPWPTSSVSAARWASRRAWTSPRRVVTPSSMAAVMPEYRVWYSMMGESGRTSSSRRTSPAPSTRLTRVTSNPDAVSHISQSKATRGWGLAGRGRVVM